MKKTVQFFRSMRFGILLLALIALLSVAGTAIPQGREVAWYAQTYQQFHGVILALRLHDVFHSWYFQMLLILLGLNLTLCSLVRIRKLSRAKKAGREVLLRLPAEFALDEKQHAAIQNGLRAMRCREEACGDSLLYSKNAFGRYGSFVTHLSILLVIVFGAMALYIPKTVDRACLPGESVTMDDGTRIAVRSFRIENEEGRLDFTSELTVTLPDGRESGLREIKVNHPLSFSPWKIYQQTYGTAGAVTVQNLETGMADTFTLTDLVFLSLDGVNGLWYEAVYPDLIRDPSGNVTLITNTAGSYPNPVYQVQTASDGVYTPILAFPGEELQVGTLKFRFEDPVEYPGLRIKYTPGFINALLCGAFLMLTAGFYITFFCQPVQVRLDRDGCAVGGPKPEGMRIRIREWTEETG